MENQFFVDSEHLSPAALEKKHRLETDPSSRKNHMEYMPGMEVIQSDVCRQVMEHMESYDSSRYTARDVIAFLAPHGVSPSRAVRLYREYGEETMDIVRILMV